MSLDNFEDVPSASQQSDQGSPFAEQPSIESVPPTDGVQEQEEFLRDDPNDSQEIYDLKQNLKAGFHRQLNKLKDQATASTQDASKLDAITRKAQAFDNLLQNPQALDALKTLSQQQQMQAQSAIPFDSQSIVTRMPKELTDKFEADHLPSLVNLTWQVIEQGLIPLLRPYQTMLEQQLMTTYNTEKTALAQDFPDASTHMKAAEQMAAQKGLTLRQAMLLLTNQAAPQQRQNTQGASGRVLPRSVPNGQVARNSPGASDDDIARELFEMDQGNNKRYSLNFMRRG